MIKNWKFATGYALSLWGIMFIGISALMVIPVPKIWQQLGEIVLSGVASYVLALLYFNKFPGKIIAALILGVYWFIIGGILDLLITVQYVAVGKGFWYGLKTFYGMWSLWVGFLLMFAGIIIAALMAKAGDEQPSAAMMTPSPSAESPVQPTVPPALAPTPIQPIPQSAEPPLPPPNPLPSTPPPPPPDPFSPPSTS